MNTLESKLNEAKYENPPHQPPPSPKGKSRGWIWAVVGCVLITGMVFSILRRPAPAQPGQGRRGLGMMAVPVNTAVVRKGDIGVYTNGLGIVTPVYTVNVKSRVDGELMEVKYVEGQMVHKGDPLLEIDPRPYQAALLQMEGQLKRDQALLTNSFVDLERYKLAFASNAIPEQQLATQKATVQQYEGTVELDKGMLSNAFVQLLYCHIPAEVTGRVGLRLVDPGNIVHATDMNPLAVIAQIQPITVVFSVAEDALPEIQRELSQGNKLTVEAYDREIHTKLATGTVITTDNQIDVTTGTVRIKALFSNEDSSLFPNQFVNARLLVRTDRDATLVPDAAVRRDAEQGSFVYVVQPDETVAMRPVKVGPTETRAGGDITEVEGVQVGDVVVTNNFNRLLNGSKIKIAGSKPEEGPGRSSGPLAENAADKGAVGGREGGPSRLGGASDFGPMDKDGAGKGQEGPKKARRKAGKAAAGEEAAAPHE